MEFSGERCLTPQPTTRGSMYFKFKQIGSLDLISAKSSSNTPQPKNTKKNRRKTRGKPPSFLGHKLVVFYLLLEGCCLYLKRSWVQFEFETSFEQYPQHGRRSVSGWPFALFRGFWALWRNAKDASESKHHSFECLIECLWDTWAHYLQLAVFVCFQQFTILEFLKGEGVCCFFFLLFK